MFLRGKGQAGRTERQCRGSQWTEGQCVDAARNGACISRLGNVTVRGAKDHIQYTENTGRHVWKFRFTGFCFHHGGQPGFVFD